MDQIICILVFKKKVKWTVDIEHFGQLLFFFFHYAWCFWWEEYKTLTENILLSWHNTKETSHIRSAEH